MSVFVREPHASVDKVVDILKAVGLTPTEALTLPGHPARCRPIPAELHSKVRDQLVAAYPEGLYSHQAEGLSVFMAGSDVCLATPTASGKSLVFMSAAADLVLRDRFARVLALYPAKALIRDQLTKWHAFMQPFGVGVGFIDGSVPVSERRTVVASNRVVAMTPDVAHAWLMSRLAEPVVADFLTRLRLLVLDEAHVYDGAFGTNMAYFLRRLNVAAKKHRLICSTATVGEPGSFMRLLTGRAVDVIDADADGSRVPEKTLLLSPLSRKAGFDKMVQLLLGLTKYGKARFLAFGDSRKAVERIVAAMLRSDRNTGNTEEDPADDDSEPAEPGTSLEHVLPFRAGYEEADRTAIQRALTDGTLRGVVSTSAMELGLDIGDLDIVVLLNAPPGSKAFRQRIGRAGRRRESVCVILDDQGIVAPLSKYAARMPEPSWLYLDNRYIQYANALCAAAELQACGVTSTVGVEYPGLPQSFRAYVENELNPTEGVPPDLYALKQRGQGNPHYEFPIRSAAEPNFEVEGPFGLRLGTLSYAQALREAYPGAVYYYMARPYRVLSLEFKRGRIGAGRARYLTTKPIAENIAFPDFKNGVLAAWSSAGGFACEVELQVSERVKGFIEQRGQKSLSHEYGPSSPYSQKPLTRFFRTTGLCWSFVDDQTRSQDVVEAVKRAFAVTCGIEERDLGTGYFKSNAGPYNQMPASGVVIFDATNGSLRLTQRLGPMFADVVLAAVEQAEDAVVKTALLAMQRHVLALETTTAAESLVETSMDKEWVSLVARNQPAVYLNGEEPVEVTVLDFRYTPHGVMYELESLPRSKHIRLPNGEVARRPGMKWMVLATHVQPVHGTTRMMRVNLTTGEESEQ
jgi:DEAD/DEAH box helicase domain-containing protein